MISQYYRAHLTPQQLIQFGSVFSLLENQRVPLALSSFVVCEQPAVYRLSLPQPVALSEACFPLSEASVLLTVELSDL